MNTFKGINAALEYEIARQLGAVSRGGVIVQETRRWDPDAGETQSMRTKENAHDYRYFPEPDLVPVALSAEQVEAWRALLPELPSARRERMVKEYGIPEYDAAVLADAKENADFF
jgi:aspartyl-tRNA(Asn)/glutamyl-tRNA(Gln) amidotransferase subunit B